LPAVDHRAEHDPAKNDQQGLGKIDGKAGQRGNADPDDSPLDLGADRAVVDIGGARRGSV
jgi:hypothetical protein